MFRARYQEASNLNSLGWFQLQLKARISNNAFTLKYRLIARISLCDLQNQLPFYNIIEMKHQKKTGYRFCQHPKSTYLFRNIKGRFPSNGSVIKAFFLLFSHCQPLYFDDSQDVTIRTRRRKCEVSMPLREERYSYLRRSECRPSLLYQLFELCRPVKGPLLSTTKKNSFALPQN